METWERLAVRKVRLAGESIPVGHCCRNAPYSRHARCARDEKRDSYFFARFIT
jgi:hypothetical protein